MATHVYDSVRASVRRTRPPQFMMLRSGKATYVVRDLHASDSVRTGQEHAAAQTTDLGLNCLVTLPQHRRDAVVMAGESG